MRSTARKRHGGKVEPAMTPLIDIIFNLLIFFMLMPVEPPEAYLTTRLPRTGPRDEQVPPRPLHLEIGLRDSGPRGEEVAIVLNRTLALGSDFRALQAALEGYRARGLKDEIPVRIAPAPAVRHRWVVRAWDAAAAAGFQRVEFAVPAHAAGAG